MSRPKKQSHSELLQLCKDRGLKGCTALKKAQLVERLAESSSTSIQEPSFVYQPMITYLGNKRKLVPWIMEIIQSIYNQFDGKPLRMFDAFAGSGVISRALMPFCYELHSNDMELYSYILLRCFLETPTPSQKEQILFHFQTITDYCQTHSQIGFITKLYSPLQTSSPQPNERCFYTRENAILIDTILYYIFNYVTSDLQHYLLGPLLIKSSINVNTAGVFRGFYKKNGIGHFGGNGENALERILATIQPSLPIWSTYPCKSFCYNSDILTLLPTFSDKYFDIIYLDPPYNEHPYGSNYFMLNLIASNQEPTEYSRISGIPKEWNKSTFNGRNSVFESMLQLLKLSIQKSQIVLLSYNDEGLISEEDWIKIWNELKCSPKIFKKSYDTYHGSRNLSSRNKTVYEILYLIS